MEMLIPSHSHLPARDAHLPVPRYYPVPTAQWLLKSSITRKAVSTNSSKKIGTANFHVASFGCSGNCESTEGLVVHLGGSGSLESQPQKPGNGSGQGTTFSGSRVDSPRQPWQRPMRAGQLPGTAASSHVWYRNTELRVQPGVCDPLSRLSLHLRPGCAAQVPTIPQELPFLLGSVHIRCRWKKVVNFHDNDSKEARRRLGFSGASSLLQSQDRVRNRTARSGFLLPFSALRMLRCMAAQVASLLLLRTLRSEVLCAQSLRAPHVRHAHPSNSGARSLSPSLLDV
eukprot:1161426-Rhodomonas_salina.2